MEGCFIVQDRAGAQTHGGLVERRIRFSPVLKKVIDSIKEKGGVAIQDLKTARVYKRALPAKDHIQVTQSKLASTRNVRIC